MTEFKGPTDTILYPAALPVMMGTMAHLWFKYASISAMVLVGLYAGFLGLLTTSFFQAHVVDLHKSQMAWFKDLDVPKTFGFLRSQTAPFFIKSSTGGMLYAWHILPIELYRQHESALVAEPTGFALDFTSRFTFRLLRDDPDARLIIHMHGAGGTQATEFSIIARCRQGSPTRFTS